MVADLYVACEAVVEAAATLPCTRLGWGEVCQLVESDPALMCDACAATTHLHRAADVLARLATQERQRRAG